MLPFILDIQAVALKGIQEIFGVEIPAETLNVQETPKQFEGDYTIVTFPLAKLKLGAPPQIAEKLGQYFLANASFVESYAVVQGYLNLQLFNNEWKRFIVEHQNIDQDSPFFQLETGKGKKIMIEYCSPNTNKPLHLGHLRNMILGNSVTRLFAACGYEAIPVCLYNDRGTAICKSMYAWQTLFAGITPENYEKHLGKGDKLVGDCYVSYGKIVEEELISQGLDVKALSKDEKKAAEKNTKAAKAVDEMLLKWEAGDPETRALWQQMNEWVYTANAKTFKRLGLHFERFYYESDVYELGRETVTKGLEAGIFSKDANENLGIDLTNDGLDFKVLVRKNGTTVYMTQDIGTADKKYEDYGMERSVYVVGNEQDYHFKVLFLIMKKLGRSYADGMYHLSYGMVDLPDGKMKSREGTTVEAEDLLDEVIATAKAETLALGKTGDMEMEEIDELSRKLGIGALIYFLSKVDTQKRMIYDPKESVDLHGNTGPFIQYAYTRTQSLRKEAVNHNLPEFTMECKVEERIAPSERTLIKLLYKYPEMLHTSAESYNPSIMANYLYDVAKGYNRFYHECRVLEAEKPYLSAARFAISKMTGETLRKGLYLLGIEVPERM